MPAYDSLSSQITLLKNDITTFLNQAGYTSQDLVFIATALNTAGTMLGVNDIVAATADQITQINSAGSAQITAVNNAGSTATAAVLASSNNFLTTFLLMGA